MRLLQPDGVVRLQPYVDELGALHHLPAVALTRQRDGALLRVRPAVVVLEDLNVDGMKRNRKLALSISDVGLGEFRRQMTYKTTWQGEILLVADRWFPSTKRCSRCGNVKEDMDLSERIYVCENPGCSLVIDRDVNAALNLAALTKPTNQPGPYREFLGKGETPVERGALAVTQTSAVKLPSAKQEPRHGCP